MNTNTVIVWGPQGAGKTRNSEQLAKWYGCNAVVDPWGEGPAGVDEALVPNALHLTHVYPGPQERGVLVDHFDAAMLLVNGHRETPADFSSAKNSLFMVGIAPFSWRLGVVRNKPGKWVGAFGPLRLSLHHVGNKT